MKIESSRQVWTEQTDGRRLAFLELLTEPKNLISVSSADVTNFTFSQGPGHQSDRGVEQVQEAGHRLQQTGGQHSQVRGHLQDGLGLTQSQTKGTLQSKGKSILNNQST